MFPAASTASSPIVYWPARRRFPCSGCTEENIEIIRIPGSWELPVVVGNWFASGTTPSSPRAVIRGDTPHFDYVAGEAARGLAHRRRFRRRSRSVLTCNTVEQAVDRPAQIRQQRFDAAMTAIEMANLMRRLRKPAK
jgi:6,7-dimethyl-8-ribityllumazine synthase